MSDEDTASDNAKEETEEKTETKAEKTEERRKSRESSPEESPSPPSSPPSNSRPSRSSHRTRDGGGSGPPPTKLYIGNLPDNCKRSELSELFEKFGDVEQCDVLRNFAFVHFKKEEEAQKAVDKLDDSEFMGVHIQVQQARSRGKPTAGENECFECGKEGHWARDCPRRRGSRRPPPRSSYRGPDTYRSDSSRGYRDSRRDSYYDYYYGGYGRYPGPSRYSPYGSSYGSSYSYSSYGSSKTRSRSPPRSYGSAYAYPPRR